MRADVKRDFDWQSRYYREIEAILRSLAHVMVDFRLGTDEEDMKRATDFVIHVESGGTVAGRMRRLVSNTGRRLVERDLTLRLRRPSGVETEEQKILNGWGRWYLYIWTDQQERIAEWMFVDLDAMRAQWLRLVPHSTTHENWDKSSTFRCIPARVLDRFGCLVHWHREAYAA